MAALSGADKKGFAAGAGGRHSSVLRDVGTSTEE